MCAGDRSSLAGSGEGGRLQERCSLRERERERAFRLFAHATNMSGTSFFFPFLSFFFALSPLPASSANSYRNILASRSLFSLFTKDVATEGERKKEGGEGGEGERGRGKKSQTEDESRWRGAKWSRGAAIIPP